TGCSSTTRTRSGGVGMSGAYPLRGPHVTVTGYSFPGRLTLALKCGCAQAARLLHPKLARGRIGEVVVHSAGVRPAVDDGYDQDPAAVPERHVRTAREALVGDPKRAMGEHDAARRAVAEEAGPVPGGAGRLVVRRAGLLAAL